METITLQAGKKMPIPGVQFSNIDISASVTMNIESGREKIQEQLVLALIASYNALNEATKRIKEVKKS